MAQPGGFRINPRYLPTLDYTPAETEKPNPLTSGLVTGLGEAGAILGSAVQGAGHLIDSPMLQEGGRVAAEAGSNFAQRHARQDLEIAPWKDGGADVLPWLGYQVTKQIPQLATYLAAGAAVPEAVVPAALARAGAVLPRVLGGGGLKAGADFAARRAALQAGTAVGRTAIGAEAAGVPFAFGSMVQEADSKPGGIQPGDVGKAALLSPLYAGLDVVEPVQLKGLLQRGLKGNILKRVATAGLVGGVAEVPQEGIQTAMELSFRPDISTRDKMTHIVDAALTGGAIGGVFGGLGGLRRMKTIDPNDVSSEDLGQLVDSVLAPQTQAQLPAPGMSTLSDQDRIEVDAGGAASPTMDSGFTPSEFDVPQQAPRPFESSTTEELQAGLSAAQRRIDAGTADETISRTAEMIKSELDARSVNDTAIQNGIDKSAEAVQRDPDSSLGVVAQDIAAPVSATQDFPTRLTELKRGARNQWVKKLEAADEADLLSKVHSRIFEDQDDSKGTIAVAQRLGLLDDQLNPTALAAEVEASKKGTAQAASVTPEPAAPASLKGGDPFVDRKFQAEWKEATKGSKDPAVRALKPKNTAEAKMLLYRALGTEGVQSDVNSTKSIEAVAQRFGILDDNKQLTPEGVALAKQDPIATQDAVKAAMAQGFKGAQASVFDRGVRAYLGGDEVTTFDTFEDMGAYQAGKAWAEEHNAVPKVSSNYWSERVMDSQFRGGNQNPEQIAKSPKLTPPQLAQQAANGVIDAAGLPDTDAAMLRKMVRNGATPAEIEEAIRYVKTGRNALLLDTSVPKPEFRGEVVTRGAPRVRREVNIEDGRQRARDLQASEEAIARSNERQAFRKHLQGLVDEVEAEVAAERETAQQEMKVDSAGRLKDLPQRSDIRFSDLKQMERLEGLASAAGHVSMQDALNHLKAEASTPFQRKLAARVEAAMRMLAKRGWRFRLTILRPGDFGPALMAQSRGLTQVSEDGDVHVWLNNSEFDEGIEGTRYETLAHELVHAVTAGAVEYGVRADPGTDLAQATESLIRVVERIKDHFNGLSGRLTPFQQAAKDNITNSFDNAHEVIAWALTNRDMQSYLESIPYTPQQSFWQRLVEAVRALFGMSPGEDNALNEVIKLSEQLMNKGPAAAELLELVQRTGSNEHVMLGQHRMAGPTAARFETAVQQIKAAGDRLVRSDTLTDKIRSMMTGWMPVTHMDAHYPEMPEIHDYSEAQSNRRATASVFSQLFEEPNYAAEKQAREAPKAAEMTSKIMEATALGVDPAKPWSEHTHLHGEPNVVALKAAHAEVHRMYNVLRGQKQNHVYDALRKVNEAERLAGMTVGLQQLIMGDPEMARTLGGTMADPVENFRRDATLHNPEAARAYWHAELTKRLDMADTHFKTLRGDPALSTTDLTKLNTRLSPVESFMREVKGALTHMAQAPYFHLGRFGEHFVAGSVRLKDKSVDLDAVDHVADELRKAGFNGARISRDLNKPNIYMRVETIEERKRLANIMLKLQREGWLDKDVEVKDGPRSEGVHLSEGSRAAMEEYIIRYMAHPMFEPDASMSDDQLETLKKFKQQAEATLRHVWLDMLPDTAASKVLTHRNSVPGFSTDMLRSFAFRYQIGVNSLANLSAAPYINSAFEKMRGRLNDAKVSGSGQDVDLLNRLYSELALRESQRGQIENESWVDTWRAFNHAFFLGMSPSYMLVNLTQMGVLLWPELAKKHGFVDTAKAFAKVTPIAFNVLKTAFQQGAAVSGKRAADAVISQDVLEKSGLDKKTAEFLMGMIGSGIIDIGGAARELGRVAAGTTDANKDKMLRYAAAAGLYSETFTRLVAALSARELHKGPADKVEDYAKSVVRESMLEYSTWNVPRNMGKMGIAGQFTPVMMSFLQYNTQVMWKLYRELYDAFAAKRPGETDEQHRQRKSEARRFLLSHATAVTALAGTLGLPFATVAAAALEKIVDAVDDDEEPYDATAAWRNFLADTFGNDVGEMVARGTPRAFGEGFDLSQRVGEQNMMPFTNLLVDRRSWKDAFQQWAPQGYGSPVSMLINILTGVDKISEGDVLGGMAEGMPTAIKGPTKAFQMVNGEYVDAKGNVLPIDSPGAAALLFQLIGLNPAAKAEYSEARGDQSAREGTLSREAKQLRSRIVTAVVEGDGERARELISDAVEFDAANPAFAVLPDIEASIRRRARVQAMSSGIRAPIGVSVKDQDGQRLTRYSNVEYAPQ